MKAYIKELFAIKEDNRIIQHCIDKHSGESWKCIPKTTFPLNPFNWTLHWYCKKCKKEIT